jgi:hypothetical protein
MKYLQDVLMTSLMRNPLLPENDDVIDDIVDSPHHTYIFCIYAVYCTTKHEDAIVKSTDCY